ncbi:hypothetical protein U1Q18_009190 [Sarracenia purpurea var. burkii]
MVISHEKNNEILTACLSTSIILRLKFHNKTQRIEFYNQAPIYVTVLLCYQQYPTPAAPSHRLPVIHPQEFAPINSGQSPFVSDEHLAYTARDRILAVHSNVFFSRGESSPSSSFVHLQEVPSSYSSVTGNNSLDIYFAIEALLRAASI